MKLQTYHADCPPTKDPYSDLIECMITHLFSFDPEGQRRVLDTYYFDDATYTSPLLRTTGIDNIQRIFLAWAAFNRTTPTIDNICYDGHSMCTVFMTQSLRPYLVPFVTLHFPVVVTLTFKDVDESGQLVKITHHQEHWAIDSLIQSVPWIGYWYHRLVRVTTGKVLSTTGSLIVAASQIFHNRNKELSHICREISYHPTLRSKPQHTPLD